MPELEGRTLKIPSRVCFSVFAVLLSTFALAQTREKLRLVQAIPLPGVTGRLDHIDVDVKGQRLFVAGLEKGSVEVVDAERKRISGGRAADAGFIFVYQQLYPDHYETIAKISTRPGAGTSFFSPELDRYYVAAPSSDKQTAAILVFEPQP